MKNITELIKEAWSYKYDNRDNRAKVGNVIEIELKNDGHFYWHTPQDNDWDDFASLEPWEIVLLSKEEGTFAIKIGDLKDLKEL